MTRGAMHHHTIPTAPITIPEVREVYCLIDEWLRQREEQDRLDSNARKEFFDLFERLNDSIKLDNCDSFGKLEVKELRTDAMQIFEKIVTWANITCHEESKKFRQSLH